MATVMNRLEKRFAATQRHIEITQRSHPEFPTDAALVVRLIKHLFREIQDQANAVLRGWGLNHSEYNILMMLYGSEHYAMTPSELGECTGEKQTNITRLITQLCEKGMVSRAPSPDDGRKTLLTMTETGLATVEAFIPPISRLLNLETASLSSLEQQMLKLLLHKLLAGMALEGEEIADVIEE
ncbi:MarR family winged helix-turn-helix transcriptional regulator [Carnimonas bestiolae]|uniref:MarR family winged helix-turn-helix transcriptional regulator n=1 Tax=Carnimonas bestiolae TaxID=3402172 RepID=UPI003F4ADADE